MLGSWVETLKLYHPELNKRKPIWGDHNPDLRQNIVENRNYDQLRGRGRGKPKKPYKAQRFVDRSIDQDPQPSTSRGRGRGQPSGQRGNFRGRRFGLARGH